MANVQAEVDVHVPVPAAYDEWTQFERFPRFMTGVEQVRQLDDTTLHWVAEVGGQRHEWVAEIVEQRPDEVIARRSTERDGPIGRVTFQPIDSTWRKISIDSKSSSKAARFRREPGAVASSPERSWTTIPSDPDSDRPSHSEKEQRCRSG